MSFKTQVKEITPAYAQKLLDENKSNRSVSWDRVNHYVREMQAGKWELNGQPIVVADSGRLLDGQHRLYACVQGKVPFTTVIVTGADEGAMATLDTGKSRRAPDILSIMGFKDVNHTAAATNFVLAYYNGNISAAFASWGRYEPREIAEFVRLNPEIQTWVRFGHLNAVGIGCVTIAAAIGYLLGEESVDPETVGRYREFLERVASGLELTETSPIYHLRRRLERGSVNRPSGRREIAALFIKAWNAFCSHESMSVLRLSKNEDFPQIEGLPKKDVEA